MQVLKVSEGPVQPAGFRRNQEIIFGSEEASSKNLEVFRRIEDSQEENNADENVSDFSNMNTGSAKTSYLDRDSARTGSMMSNDWLVVSQHGRGGLSGTRKYDYHWAKSTKAVPGNFVGAPNVFTTSADGELSDGGFNRNMRSMSCQNMDTRQVKLSHDRGIENDHLYGMSVGQAYCDQIVPVSISGGSFCFNCGK